MQDFTVIRSRAFPKGFAGTTFLPLQDENVMLFSSNFAASIVSLVGPTPLSDRYDQYLSRLTTCKDAR